MKYFSTTAVTILILIAVLIPGSNIPDVGIGGIDKPVHFLMFFTWSVAVRLDFSPNFKRALCLLTGIVFSVLTEVLQILVEGRSFDYLDISADTVGLIIGLLSGDYVLKIVLKIWPFNLLKKS